MSAIQMAYYAGRLGKRNEGDTGGDGCVYNNLWVHEGHNTPSVSIDLYNFGGDGKDVCEGLDFDAVLPTEGGHTETKHLHAFCISYNPDWEDTPLLMQCQDRDEYDIDVSAEYIPHATCANIVNWIREQVKPNQQEE